MLWKRNYIKEQEGRLNFFTTYFTELKVFEIQRYFLRQFDQNISRLHKDQHFEYLAKKHAEEMSYLKASCLRDLSQ